MFLQLPLKAIRSGQKLYAKNTAFSNEMPVFIWKINFAK